MTMEQLSSEGEQMTDCGDGEDSESESSGEYDSENLDTSDASVAVHEKPEVPGKVPGNQCKLLHLNPYNKLIILDCLSKLLACVTNRKWKEPTMLLLSFFAVPIGHSKECHSRANDVATSPVNDTNDIYIYIYIYIYFFGC